MVDFTYSSNNARSLLDLCNELIAIRPRYTDRDEFAITVIQQIFADPSLDLLLIKPRADTVHADALNRLNALVGFESTVFMSIYSNDTLFNEFIDTFCRHCIRSTANNYDASESIFMWLLKQYLQYLLPIDEQRLAQLKSGNWFSGGGLSASSSSSSLSQMPTSPVTSPRRLLRPEVLAASSPLEHIPLRSGSIRTLYPRMLQFVVGIVNQLASLSNWPSVAQFQVLRNVLNHYNEFILSETEDAEFGSLKLLLLRKPLFNALLHNFLERLLKNWPLGDSYCLLIDIWLVLVSPNLTFTHRQKQNGTLMEMKCSDEKRRLFSESSVNYFVELIEVQIRRLLDSGCAQIIETPVLDFLKTEVFQNEPLIGVFEQHDLPTLEYLRAIVVKLVRYRDEYQNKCKKIQKHQSSTFWALFFRWIFNITETPPIDMQLLERQIIEIQRLINWLIEKMGGRRKIFREESEISSLFQSKEEIKPSQHSLLRPEDPDHSVDPWTKMLFLTPHGRLQVLERQARFDYSKYSRQIADTFPAIGYWDIGPLARWLHRLSIRWTNSGLVQYLRQHKQDSAITRIAAKALLSGPSPPRYVPVFARLVPKQQSTLNLRQFARLPMLIYIVFAFFFFIMFIYKYFL
uniref:Uncharacterized protein n=1 Tax=Meloidogyne enterolobii TaxID=390850 RepID=A0A6V7TZW1_MELEN|nr:unnamed protein product [Meloidogyne enterolobii]